MFGLGFADALVVGVIALVLFGTRLPSVMRSLGQSVTEFKKGLKETSAEEIPPTVGAPAPDDASPVEATSAAPPRMAEPPLERKP